MRKIQVIGVIASETDTHIVHNRTVYNFKVVEYENYKDADGNYLNKTHWFYCKYWQDGAPNSKMNSVLRIGNRIFVEGIPTATVFLSNKGEYLSSLEIDVKELEIIK